MIIHFEIPADDIERAKFFYSNLFGWEITAVPGRSNYLLIQTTDSTSLSGSLLKRFNPKQTITLYFDVSSVDEYIIKVRELGGKIAVAKKSVPETGYFAICLDTENNTFGIWEKNPDAI
jgi:uncharacterized protein